MKRAITALFLAGTLLLSLTACQTTEAVSWDAEDEVTVVGEYDKNSLTEFDYDTALTLTQVSIDDGSFLDDGYSEFKDVYTKAYTYATWLITPDSFPAAAKNPTEGVKIQVKDESYPTGQREYYLTGYTIDSFFTAMREVFTEYEARELILENKVFYIYDGALWYYPVGTGGDPTLKHKEYQMSKTDSEFEILLTTYHTDMDNAAQEYDPEKKDEYIKHFNYFKFIKENGVWKAKRFELRG